MNGRNTDCFQKVVQHAGKARGIGFILAEPMEPSPSMYFFAREMTLNTSINADWKAYVPYAFIKAAQRINLADNNSSSGASLFRASRNAAEIFLRHRSGSGNKVSKVVSQICIDSDDQRFIREYPSVPNGNSRSRK